MSDVETICTTIIALGAFALFGWMWWLGSKTPERRDPLGYEPVWRSETTTTYPADKAEETEAEQK